MIHSQFIRTIRSDIKRCIKLLPGLVLSSLLFLFAFGIILRYYPSIIFNSDSFDQINVALYLPSDSEYNQLGFSMVNNMKSVQDSLNIIQTDAPEEGYAMLENRDVVAFIIIPDRFISSILNGTNEPVHIILNQGDSFENYVVNDLFQHISALLGVAQAAVYTAYDIGVKYALDPETSISFQTGIDTGNLTYVLARESVFTENSFETLTTYSLSEQLSVSFILLILFLSCFTLTAFYKGNNNAYYIRQRIFGIRKSAVILSNSFAGFLSIYFVYIIVFAGLCITGLHPSFLSLLTMIPMIFLISLIIRLVSELTSGPHTANLLIFLIVILLLYLAGGIMPIQFLPKFLQNTASWNPMTWMIRYSLHVIF